MSSNILDEVEADSSSDDTSDDDTDYEQLPAVRMSPTAAIAGRITDVFYTGDVTDEQPRGDFGFTIEDSVADGTIFANANRGVSDTGLARDADESDAPNTTDYGVLSSDYKVVDEDDEGTDVFEGVGVETPSAGTMQGDEVEAFDEDKVNVFLSGVAGREVARRLDVNGDISAFRTKDGENTQGFVEFPDNWGTDDYDWDNDPKPRVARYPVLRDSLKGEEIVIAITRRKLVVDSYDGGMYQSAVAYNDFDGDGTWAKFQNNAIEAVRGDAEYDAYLQFDDDAGNESSGSNGSDTDLSALDEEQDDTHTQPAQADEQALREIAEGFKDRDLDLDEVQTSTVEQLIDENTSDAVSIEEGMAELELIMQE